MRLGLNDLTDAPWAYAVLGGQLDLVPRSTAKIVQPKGTLAGADEHIPPLLCIVHRILQHKACSHTAQLHVKHKYFKTTQILGAVTCVVHQGAPMSYNYTQSSVVCLLFYSVTWSGCIHAKVQLTGRQLKGQWRMTEESTSDGASSIVSGDPSQGDGGGGGCGDSQTRLIRRNCVHIQTKT